MTVRAGFSLADDPSPVGAQSRWALRLLGSPPGGPAVDGHFVQAFLDAHPDGLEPLLQRWRALGPFTVESYTPVAHKSWLRLRAADGSRVALSLITDSNGLIRVLDLRPQFEVPPLAGWADLDAALRTDGVRHSVLVARVDGDRLDPLFESAADRLMPTGSGYKLFLTRALLRAVEDRAVHWDDEVTVLPWLRSLPTGDMQDLPDGTRVPLRDTAMKMFALSDNTGGDLVMELIGRDAVERAVADSGHSDPAVLRPFLASRELFEIGWGDPTLLPAWTAADTAGRRALLAGLRRPLTATIRDLTTPVHQHGVDWFMSARDIGTVLAGLWADARREPTGLVTDILTTYPGVPVDRDHWPVSTFKGGSSPGVMMYTWLLEDPAGECHVVVLQQSALDAALVRDPMPLRAYGERIVNSLLPALR